MHYICAYTQDQVQRWEGDLPILHPGMHACIHTYVHTYLQVQDQRWAGDLPILHPGQVLANEVGSMHQSFSVDEPFAGRLYVCVCVCECVCVCGHACFSFVKIACT
jgi:hypothetical protein